MTDDDDDDDDDDEDDDNDYESNSCTMFTRVSVQVKIYIFSSILKDKDHVVHVMTARYFGLNNRNFTVVIFSTETPSSSYITFSEALTPNDEAQTALFEDPVRTAQ